MSVSGVLDCFLVAHSTSGVSASKDHAADDEWAAEGKAEAGGLGAEEEEGFEDTAEGDEEAVGGEKVYWEDRAEVVPDGEGGG